MNTPSLIALLCVVAASACSEAREDRDRLDAAAWRYPAERGDAVAQCALGNHYHFGKGVEQDLVEAAKWYRKAAEQGNADAQYNLGVSFAQGKGVVKDEVQAYKWYLLAAARGNENARKGMARLEKELGPEDRKEGEKHAKEWEAAFERKANAGK